MFFKNPGGCSNPYSFCVYVFYCSLSIKPYTDLNYKVIPRVVPRTRVCMVAPARSTWVQLSAPVMHSSQANTAKPEMLVCTVFCKSAIYTFVFLRHLKYESLVDHTSDEVISAFKYELMRHNDDQGKLLLQSECLQTDMKDVYSVTTNSELYQ